MEMGETSAEKSEKKVQNKRKMAVLTVIVEVCVLGDTNDDSKQARTQRNSFRPMCVRHF